MTLRTILTLVTLTLLAGNAFAQTVTDEKFDKVIRNMEATTGLLRELKQDVGQLKAEVADLKRRVAALETRSPYPSPPPRPTYDPPAAALLASTRPMAVTPRAERGSDLPPPRTEPEPAVRRPGGVTYVRASSWPADLPPPPPFLLGALPCPCGCGR